MGKNWGDRSVGEDRRCFGGDRRTCADSAKK